MSGYEQQISDKTKALQQVTKMKLQLCRAMSKFKIVDERGRDIFGHGWQDGGATLCHIDTVITFTLINHGFEVFTCEGGGSTGAHSEKGAEK